MTLIQLYKDYVKRLEYLHEKQFDEDFADYSEYCDVSPIESAIQDINETIKELRAAVGLQFMSKWNISTVEGFINAFPEYHDVAVGNSTEDLIELCAKYVLEE